jgi:predicted SAM-dependent methyltransferase
LSEMDDSAFVDALYRKHLGRPADDPGLRHHVQMLTDGTSRDTVEEFIERSPEAFRRRLDGAGDDAAFVDAVYRKYLARAPDPSGRQHLVSLLAQGADRPTIAARVEKSAEAKNRAHQAGAVEAMHASRCGWIRSLPAARRILDLGGSSRTSQLGALVEMGYRHAFDELVILDLPPADRHDLYKTGAIDAPVRHGSGVIRYLYRSMAFLEDVPDKAFDLVMSGQTFEHVTPEEGVQVLAEAFRVLQPGGFLALDTPNRAATAVQMAGQADRFINPDHKIEYTHAQMAALLAQSGFEVLIAQGLNHVPMSIAAGVFDVQELVTGAAQHPEIEDCYMLAYLARRP